MKSKREKKKKNERKGFEKIGGSLMIAYLRFVKAWLESKKPKRLSKKKMMKKKETEKSRILSLDVWKRKDVRGKEILVRKTFLCPLSIPFFEELRSETWAAAPRLTTKKTASGENENPYLEWNLVLSFNESLASSDWSEKNSR